MACRGCRLVEHRLCVKVVAILHHTLQHLLDAVTADVNHLCLSGFATLHQFDLFKVNTQAGYLLCQRGREIILTANGQSKQVWIVIIPTPAFAVFQRLLERAVGNNLSANAVNTQLADAGSQRDDICLANHGVETAHAVDVSHEGAALNRARIVQRRLVFVVRSQCVERRNAGDEFHT